MNLKSIKKNKKIETKPKNLTAIAPLKLLIIISVILPFKKPKNLPCAKAYLFVTNKKDFQK